MRFITSIFRIQHIDRMSYTFPASALSLITNPGLKTNEEREEENFRTGTTIGGNTYRVIRTNFVIDDELSLRVKQSQQRDAQARLLISQVYGPNFDVNNVNMNEFRGLTQRQFFIIQTYLRENQS
jgi:hypothetical protein